MTFKFACPKCQKSIKATSELAGKTAKCPDCGVKIKIPTPQPATAGAARHKAAAPPKPAPQQDALPFDEDEWEQELNPFEAPESSGEDEIKKLHSYAEPKRGLSRKSMRWARRGLWMIYFSMMADVLVGIIERTLTRMNALEADYLWYLNCASVTFQACLTLGVLLCMVVPKKTGLQMKAQTATVFQVLYFAMLGLLLFQADQMKASDASVLGVLTLLAMCGSYFSFLQYARGLAELQKQDELLGTAQTLTMFGVGVFGFVIAIPIITIILVQSETLLWLVVPLGLTALGAWIGGIIAFWMYAGLVKALAAELT
ncbi:MAG: hypothetical protein AAGJ46_20085 [Planctomycetota bacterium]